MSEPSVEHPNKRTDHSPEPVDPDVDFEDDDEGDEGENGGVRFRDLGLRQSIRRGLKKEGFKRPTDIQAALIPHIMAGRDVLGQARTGTGKTAAFALPLLDGADKKTPVQALVLVPTRELAAQVKSVFESLGRFTPINTTAIYGGRSINRQVASLKKNPHIVVATPGRIMDLHQRRIISYNNIRSVVLDEVDRMLDIGFRDDIRRILGDIPGKPQTVFVSATISEEIEKLARSFMSDPVKVKVETGSLTVEQVDQSYVTVMPWDKKRLLKHLLTHEEPDLTLVFCRMKVTVDDVARYLKRENIHAVAIHGDMPQSKRSEIIERLRGGSLDVVVASDLAARGLDVTNISHVVNYDLPEDPEIYVHRIGRTARAGRTGIAWSFVTPEEGRLLTEIEKLANVEIPMKFYPDFEPGPPPADIEAAAKAEAQRRELASESTTRYGPPPVEDLTGGKVDPVKFPGGVVPTSKPKRTLGGRVVRKRR